MNQSAKVKNDVQAKEKCLKIKSGKVEKLKRMMKRKSHRSWNKYEIRKERKTTFILVKSRKYPAWYFREFSKKK